MKWRTPIYLIFIAILCLIPAAVATSLSYSLSLAYEANTFSLKHVTLSSVAPQPALLNQQYTIQILSFKQAVLYETTFEAVVPVFYSEPLVLDHSYQTQKTSTPIDLVLPYYPNAEKIVILSNKSLLFEIDVSPYSVCNENEQCEAKESPQACSMDCTCGNKVCDEHETYLQCSTDCLSGEDDGACDKIADGICDPDCRKKEDFDCKGAGFSTLIIGLFMTAVIITCACVFYLKRKKK